MSDARAEEAKAAARAKRDARKVRWGQLLGFPLITVLGNTWRVREERHPAFEALFASGKPYILSSWHGQLITHIWANRFRGICAMVSQHGDGEIITRIMQRWGYRHVRGSSSRGGKEALIAMIRELEQGSAFALTPDGPRGPAGIPQSGILIASQRSGVPIIPMRTENSRAWHFRSWDRFQLPKPFARVRVIYGEPWVATGTDEPAKQELIVRMGPAPAPPTRAP